MPKSPRFFAQLLLVLLVGLSCLPVFAESGGESAVKTAFLYNFFKFIEWPDEIGSDGYRLCTASNDQLGDSLSVLENKTLNGKPMLVYRGIGVEALKACHMVYIGSSENTELVINGLMGLPIVTVSDVPDFVGRGGMIGLVQDGNRLSFEINLDLANIEDVHISAKLLKLAKKVFTIN
jgi:hypothetical protein